MAKTIQPRAQFILASSSSIRKQILTDAGYVIEAIAPNIDETRMRFVAKAASISPSQTAQNLAKAKAIAISNAHPGWYVLSADQILTCEDRWHSKPINTFAAHAQLLELSDKRHVLHTAVCLMPPDSEPWAYNEESYLTMRHLSSDFIKNYLISAGANALNSPGCYQLEKRGSQLFELIEGDFFAILGLPLIPTMRALRANEIVPL